MPPDQRELDLIVCCVLHLFLVARHVGLPAFDPRLEFTKRAPSRRNDRAQKLSFPSSCRRIISLLQSPPCLQQVLPRVGDNVIRFITRDSHERCMHLLQHKPQVLHSFRSLFSSPLQHHLGLFLIQASNASASVENPPLCERIFSEDQGLSHQ